MVKKSICFAKNPIFLCVASQLYAISPALSQNANLPPSVVSVSPGGVSMQTGSFTTASVDLSIGGTGFPTVLELRRSYDSSTGYLTGDLAGFGAQGWTHNLAMGVAVPELQRPDELVEGCDAIPSYWLICADLVRSYYRSISTDRESFIFASGNSWTQTGANVSNYTIASSEFSGNTLIFTGTESTGNYTLTTRDGSTYLTNRALSGGFFRVAEINRPNGEKITLTFVEHRPKSAFSNTGIGIVFEYGTGQNSTRIVKACAVNRSKAYVSASGNCPSGSPFVAYSYIDSSMYWHTQYGAEGPVILPQVGGVTDTNGGLTTYEYATGGAFGSGGKITCIKKPGQSTCSVSNSYSTCQQDPTYYPESPGARFPDLQLYEAVRTQTFGDGRQLVYNSAVTPVCPPQSIGESSNAWYGPSTFTDSSNATTSIELSGSKVSRFQDPLGRVTTATYDAPGMTPAAPSGLLTNFTLPGGQIVAFTYDGRGNPLTKTTKSPPGSNLPDIVESWVFPTSCAVGSKSCNSPTSHTDARGATTNWTYSSQHGGVESEMLPAAAAGAARPLKLRTYSQRYAWTKSATGTMVQQTSPIWLIATEKVCQTVAGSNSPICDSSAKQIVTTYEYGATGTDQSLLLKGLVVGADGTNLRTCYSYDDQLRQISKTAPNANLVSCP